MNTKVTTIDEYLDGVDLAFRGELQRIRELVTALVPGVEESISYSMHKRSKFNCRSRVRMSRSRKSHVDIKVVSQ